MENGSSKLEAFGKKLAEVLPALFGGGGTDADKKKAKEELIKKLPELIPLYYGLIIRPTADDIALMSVAVTSLCLVAVDKKDNEKGHPLYDAKMVGRLNDALQRYLKFKAEQLDDDDGVVDFVTSNITPDLS